MDHPGFVADRCSMRPSAADVSGWVLAENVQGQRVQFFVGDTQVSGTVSM